MSVFTKLVITVQLMHDFVLFYVRSPGVSYQCGSRVAGRGSRVAGRGSQVNSADRG